MIPLDNMADFLPTAADGRYQSSRFFSLSRELITTTIKKIVETFAADPVLRHGTYDICFGHAASERASEILLKRLGIPQEIYYSIHSRYGNTVSASVPLAMSLALEEQRLRRGDRLSRGDTVGGTME